MEDIKEQKNRLVLWTILTLSIAGFVDATYLAMKRLIGSPVTCYAFNGCGTVDASPFSSIFGIPLSLLGAIFYGITILLLVQYFLRKQKKILNLAVIALIFGGVFSIYLIILQAFFIKAWCLYCLIADTIGIVNALLILYVLKNKK
jgi:uncharacterized membrane protein